MPMNTPVKDTPDVPRATDTIQSGIARVWLNCEEAEKLLDAANEIYALLDGVSSLEGSPVPEDKNKEGATPFCGYILSLTEGTIKLERTLVELSNKLRAIKGAIVE